jgi:hypothetical protein
MPGKAAEPVRPRLVAAFGDSGTLALTAAAATMQKRSNGRKMTRTARILGASAPAALAETLLLVATRTERLRRGYRVAGAKQPLPVGILTSARLPAEESDRASRRGKAV